MFWITCAVADIANRFPAVLAIEYSWETHNVTVKLPGTDGNEKGKSLDPHGSIPLDDGIVENPEGHEIVAGIAAQSKLDDI